MRVTAGSAWAVVVGLGCIEVFAQATNVAPANPPRTQQEILQERRAACRDLKEAEFRECMNNYVGTPDKSQAVDRERDDKDRPSAPGPQPDHPAPGKTEPKK